MDLLLQLADDALGRSTGDLGIGQRPDRRRVQPARRPIVHGGLGRPAEGRSRFGFDLGSALETWPYDDRVLEQWMLYCPGSKVFTYRSDGRANFKPGSGEGSGDEASLAAR